MTMSNPLSWFVGRLKGPDDMELVNWASLPVTYDWRINQRTRTHRFYRLFGQIQYPLNILIMAGIVISSVLNVSRLRNPDSVALWINIVLTVSTIVLLIFREHCYIVKFYDAEIGNKSLYTNVYFAASMNLFLAFTLTIIIIIAVNPILLSLIRNIPLVIVTVQSMIIFGVMVIVYYFNVSFPITSWGKERIFEITDDAEARIPRRALNSTLNALIRSTRRKQLSDAVRVLSDATSLDSSAFSDVISTDFTELNRLEKGILLLPKIFAWTATGFFAGISFLQGISTNFPVNPFMLNP